jgi:tetratricopeptide (TPR) repeat protein
LSTIFALDKFRAFWGDVERAEGLVGLFFFFAIFFLIALLFGKKDYLMFFKLTLVTGGIFFVHELIQFFQGVDRPSSFMGNPIYLAAYYLFVIFSSAVLAQSSRVWRWSLAAIIPLSVVGIFLTQTRGVILGLGAALIVLLVYFIVRGKETALFGKISLRRAAVIALATMAVLGAIFYSTQGAGFWKKIPGFDRLVGLTSQDPTFQTRLISLGVSLKAINPVANGIERLLVGWGPENFSIAYNKYYNPKYFRYENSWFDRAHNKLMDVFVMNGVLGFLAYCAIWISAFWLMFKKKGLSWESGALIFFGVSYFVQNLFVFDSIATYPTFFLFLAFAIYYFSGESPQNQPAQRPIAPGIILAGASLFAIVILAFSAAGYFQMRSYMNGVNTGNISAVKEAFENSITPYSYVQQDIRTHFATYLGSYYSQWTKIAPLAEESIRAMDEMIRREPYNPRFSIYVAKLYAVRAQILGQSQFYQISEDYYKKALELSPNRQDTRDFLAYDYALEGNLDKAIALLKETVALDPEVGDPHFFLGFVLVQKGLAYYKEALGELEKALTSKGTYQLKGNFDSIKGQYYKMLSYFFGNRQTGESITILNRLAQIDPSRKSDYETISGYIQRGEWSKLNLSF